MSIPTLGLDFMPGAGPFDVPGYYYLNLTGASGSRVSTPDHASLDITTTDLSGAIELAAPVGLSSTSPGYEVWSKYVSSGNQRSWHLRLKTDGTLLLFWSADGTNVLQANSTAPIPRPQVGSVTVGWWLDVDNGAAGRTITFYAREGDLAGLLANLGTSVLGTAVVQAGTTSIFNSTAPVDIGDLSGTGDPAFVGKVRRAQLRNGNLSTGTIVANPDFAAQAPGTTSFADSAGRTWTVNSPAEIVGFDWVDITSRLLGASWSWGRTDPLSTFSPGEAEVVLGNEDRQLDPTYSSGTWFGELNPRVPFRLRMSNDGGSTWKDQFYGFVEGGFEQTYFQPSWATCTVKLVDILEVIGSTRLPRTAYQAEVLTDNPEAFWQLDETSGSQMADSSVHRRHGIYDNSILGQDPLVAGDGHSLSAPNDSDSRGYWSGDGLPTASPCTLEAWVKLPRDLLAVKSIIVAQRDSALGQALWLKVDSSVGSPNGELLIHFHGLGTGYKARGHARVDDDQPHHVVCTIAGNTPGDVILYVDSVVQTKTTVTAGNPGAWTSLRLWSVGNTIDNGVGDYGLGGLIDEAAVYSYVLTADQVAAHYLGGSTAFSGEATGARVDRVLDIIGMPTELREIATGDTTCGPAEYDSATVGDYLRGVAESEQGYLYVDHANGGKLTFKGRYNRLTATRSTTSQATFTDTQPTPGGQYAFRNIHPSPNGIASIVNDVQVRWPGGVENVGDDASQAAYGARSRTLTTEAPTPVAAASAGNWMIARFGQPQSRIRSFELYPAGDSSSWNTVLDLRVSDRVTINWKPQNVGTQISQPLIIEGVNGKLSGGLEWEMSYQLSDADDTQVWIWGTSTWDETTTWG